MTLLHPSSLVANRRRVALASALAVVVLVLLLVIVWPAYAVFVLIIGGMLVAAAVAAAFVGSRSPYFRSKDDVERELRLRVLATCAWGSDR